MCTVSTNKDTGPNVYKNKNHVDSIVKYHINVCNRGSKISKKITKNNNLLQQENTWNPGYYYYYYYLRTIISKRSLLLLLFTATGWRAPIAIDPIAAKITANKSNLEAYRNSL